VVTRLRRINLRRVPRWVFLPIAAALALLVFLLVRASRLPVVTLTPVTRGQVVAAVYAPGTVTASTETVVAAAAAGRVTAYYVHLGSAVARGQVVAQLDNSQAQLQRAQAQQALATARAQYQQALANVQAAQARVATARQQVTIAQEQVQVARAQIGVADARVDAGRAGVASAQDAVTRAQYLYQRGAIAQRQVVEARAALQSAEAQLAEAQAGAAAARQGVAQGLAGVSAAQAQVVEAQNAVTGARAAAASANAGVQAAAVQVQQAQTALGNYTVRSLVNGTISDTPVQVGDYVQVGMPVARVVSAASLYVRADVDEADIGPVAVGQTAYFTSDTTPNVTYRGVVGRIGASAATATNTYPVDITHLTPLTGLRVNMSVDVNLVTRVNPDALLLPASAVVEDPSPHVWRVVRGRLTRVPVVVGARDANTGRVELLNGVRAGEQVVANPEISFSEGRRVRVR
jgi:RND family efflux transporter MFP subunit